MKLTGLRTRCRTISGDTAKPPQTSDLEWDDLLNEAQDEAARRARLFVDSTTPELCEIALNAVDATYPLDERVIFVRRARLDGKTNALGRASYKDLDEQRPGWESDTGEPTSFVPDFDSRSFRPYPSPDAAYTAKLTVVRLALERIEGDVEPELRAHLQLRLVDYALAKHFAKPDPDVHDETRSKYHMDLFEAEFGAKSSALDEQWQETQYGFTGEEGQF